MVLRFVARHLRDTVLIPNFWLPVNYICNLKQPRLERPFICFRFMVIFGDWSLAPARPLFTARWGYEGRPRHLAPPKPFLRSRWIQEYTWMESEGAYFCRGYWAKVGTPSSCCSFILVTHVAESFLLRSFPLEDLSLTLSMYIYS